MSDDRNRGTHLGYLQYHLKVLSDTLQELDADLEEIRDEYTGDERKIKEQQRFLNFREDVNHRCKKSNKQVDGVKEHETEDTIERSNSICESAYNTHQEEDPDELPQDIGFKKASELNE